VAPTLATFVLVALFLCAARWQYTRMIEREGLRARLDAAQREAPVELPRDVTDWSAWRYRPVTLAGHYAAAYQILLDNRVEAERVGFHVVAPLVLADGRAVLVDRGFVAAGASRRELPQVPVPSGRVVVHGWIDLPPRYFEWSGAKPVGVLWQNLDPAKFAAATGVDVAPIVVLQDAADAQDGLVRNWPPPDLGADRNRSYMLQWIAFALCALGLWTWFVVIKPRRAR
jgi:surfeit locus 1 family protein